MAEKELRWRPWPWLKKGHRRGRGAGHGGGQERRSCWLWWQQGWLQGVQEVAAVVAVAVGAAVAMAAVAAGRIRQSLARSRPCPEGWCRFTG